METGSMSSSGYVRQRVQHLEDALRCAARRGELDQDVVQRGVGLPNHVPVELEGDELADGERPVLEDDNPAVPQDQDPRREVRVPLNPCSCALNQRLHVGENTAKCLISSSGFIDSWVVHGENVLQPGAKRLPHALLQRCLGILDVVLLLQHLRGERADGADITYNPVCKTSIEKPCNCALLIT